MIDLALHNLYLVGAVLVIGIVIGRWAFSSRKAPAEPENKNKNKPEDEARP